MSYIEVIKNNNDFDIMFELNNKNNNIKISLANAIRRTALSDIPIFATEKENVKIFKNTSVLNSSILSHRLSLCPIFTNEFIESNHKNINLILDIKNNDNIIKSIYLSDFKATDNNDKNIDINKIFPLTDILFAKLKYNEEISLISSITKGTAKKKGANFCSVGTISYSFKKDDKLINKKINGVDDEEKNKIKLLTGEKIYLKNKKNQPNIYIFRIETVFNMSSKELLNKTLNQIKKKLNNLISNIENYDEYTEKSPIKIYKPDTNIDLVQFDIINEDYTLGNLIKSYAYDIDEIKYSGYAKFHPLNNLLSIRIGSKKNNNITNIKNIIIKISNNIIKVLDELIEEANKI